MYAQLGDHVFQGIKTPIAFSESDAVQYGQIPRVNDKPAIQPTGSELKEIRLAIQYSTDFCIPSDEIDALKKSMTDFEVLPYITGEGRVIGKFVITSLETTHQQCAADGLVEMAMVNINLMESPGGPDPEPPGEALASQDPITESPPEPPAEPTAEIEPGVAKDIMNQIAAAKSKIAAIKQVVKNIKGKITAFKRGVREIRKMADNAKQLYETAKNKVENTIKIIERASQLPTSLEEAMKYAENLAKIDTLTDLSVIENNVNELSQSADKVASRAAPVAGFVATKEGGK